MRLLTLIFYLLALFQLSYADDCQSLRAVQQQDLLKSFLIQTTLLYQNFASLVCYNGAFPNVTTSICRGVCVIKYEIDANFGVKVVSGCQKHIYYKKEIMPAMCSDDEIPYPNMISYYIEKSMVMVNKYCCREEKCNHIDNFRPVMPQKYTSREKDELYDLDKMQLVIMMIILGVASLLPIYYEFQTEIKDRHLMNLLHQPIEKTVALMNRKPRRYRQRRTYLPINGQMTLDKLCETLARMELLEVKDRHVAVLNDARFIEQIVNCSGNGHSRVKVQREVTVVYENMVWSLLEHGPYLYEWKANDLISVFDKARCIFEAEPNLLNLSLPLSIVGDIRGQYQDLFRWLQILKTPPIRKILFLGGVVDPTESGSLDCLALICTLKIAYPKDVFLIRGVGESMPINFGVRYGDRNDHTVRSAATRLCNSLPIAAFLNQKILCVHSGISPEITNPKAFETFKRPFYHDEMPSLVRNIIFNKPTTAFKMYRYDPESDCYHFGLRAVTKLCSEMNIRMIIRARHALESGILYNNQGQLISVYSAPGNQTNFGVALYITESFFIKAICMEKQPENSS